MLARYLVSQGVINSQKSKRRSDKAVSSPQASEERTFHVNCQWRAHASLPKSTVYGSASVSALFLNFHQMSGSCSNTIVLIKGRAIQRSND